MSLTRQQLMCACSLLVLRELECLEKEETEKRKKPKYWINPFLLKRGDLNIEETLLQDLLWDESEYKNFCRMDIHKFEELLALVDPVICKKDTTMRYAIPSRTRLAITLRYLASGDSFRSLEFLTRVSRKTISAFIPEVLSAIYDALQPKYLKFPRSEQEWKQIADDFNAIWDFPHTLGSLDGKHIRIKPPPNSGSSFYNYKGFFSIVLFAIVDANSKFIYINVGANGKCSDSTIYNESFIRHALNNGKLKIPAPAILGPGKLEIPYFFVGDDAFALDKHLMKPYSRQLALTVQQEIFNYRHSRTSMTIEMAFGRLAQRFRIFHRPIEVLPTTCDAIVMCCCVLHNYLSPPMKRGSKIPDNFVPEKLPETFRVIGPQIYKTYKHACKIRDEISVYCVTDGNVDFQWKKINKVNT